MYDKGYADGLYKKPYLALGEDYRKGYAHAVIHSWEGSLLRSMMFYGVGADEIDWVISLLDLEKGESK